jgi:5-(carboxyamino)imidazole ribonucleotide synthase
MTSDEDKTVLPGATIGVLGSGQLGRMFALDARRMGYRVHTFSPDSDTPTGQISDEEITASYDDLDALAAFAEEVDVVTIEFENIPAPTLEYLADRIPVRPGALVLHTTQHRVREKLFLEKAGLPVVPHSRVSTLNELHSALLMLDYPAVLKTADWGYDGKGQRIIRRAGEAETLFAELDGVDVVLEKFISFERELSVIAARGLSGEFVHYGVVENSHLNHILDYTLAPAALAPRVERRAIEIAESVLAELGVVGVLCVEFFLTADEQLYVNELAPRPHNSGHWTIDACITSQFEQQLRAVCGLPLGDAEILRPAAMVNLLGDLWDAGEPQWAEACRAEGVKLHLYGKQDARPGRKMGHLTVLDAIPANALRRALEARDNLTPVSFTNCI